MEQKLRNAVSGLPETKLNFENIKASVPQKAGAKRPWLSLAACVLLLIVVGLGSYGCAAEVKAYNDAVQFFDDNGLSTEGLTRGEIKAVYRDITTNSFSYAKTLEVITSSLSAEEIGGYEIPQENPTPEDVENLWNFKNFNGGFLQSDQTGIHYQYHSEYKMDDKHGIEVIDISYMEKYDGETLVWSVPIPISGFWIDSYSVVSDGVIAYGQIETWSSAETDYAWMVKISAEGKLLWTHMLNNGFEDEYIAAVLENADGSYAVISRGDWKYFCLSQYSAEGKETHFQKTEIGNYGIWNAARFGDGYIVQLGSYMTDQYAKIVKVDREGNITESFSYSSEDAYYYITDMIEYDGNIYLSAYAVPVLEDEGENAGGRYEIAAILNYLFDHNIWEISSEELTPMVRDNYTAMLLVCDPNVGTPQEFYSVKGSLGGKLALSDSGNLLWDVESITTTFFSPATSAFTIGGTSYVFRYTFEESGRLVSQEKTGEIMPYHR